MRLAGVLVGVLLLALSLSAQRVAPFVGQLGDRPATVDGVEVPLGTTLFDGSILVTRQQSVAVHLKNGQLLRVQGNSSARFKYLETGEFQVHVVSGTVSYRRSDGSVATVNKDNTVTFTQRRSGEPVDRTEEGLVAIVARVPDHDRAEEGKKEVPVNDPSRIEPTSQVLLKTNLERIDPVPEDFVQEIKCSIESIRGQVVVLGDDLDHTFRPEDFVIQRATVDDHKVCTLLKEDVGAGSELLDVLDSRTVNPLEPVVVRSIDGRFREVGCVQHTLEDLPDDLEDIVVDRTLESEDLPRSVIRLRKGLRHDYVRGAEIRQGTTIKEERLVARTDREASSGDRVLKVQDASEFDPLQQILLRSPDETRFEAYCIASIEHRPDIPRDPSAGPVEGEEVEEEELDLIHLAEGIDFDYPVGTELLQGRSSQELVASGVAIQRVASCCCCCDTFFFPAIVWWKNPWPWVVGGAAVGTTVGIIIGGGGEGDGGDDEPEPPPSITIPTG